MANPQKGEISITVDGKDYTLVLTMNAMCELENMFSTPDRPVTYDQIMARVTAGSLSHTRAIVWAILRKHHPMTLQDAGNFIEAAGGLEAFASAFAEMAKSANADPQDLKEAGIKPTTRPPQARPAQRVGTGARSTSMPGASD